ncbi:lipopolysaccharide assembly protein LapB [Streptomyces sp. ISL-11]|uniref:tetratricopeptide repeat protein n=1 Tax=Streptomyces sp. ISL-11 TaxID=2819174 RepID=UPI001BE98112|nr:translation initiation factor IF-2 [Streptomyces sp. ISL-11]MBT2383516.1 translation initiation factor IF-2 [Streptomyces sp. ISL-11]
MSETVHPVLARAMALMEVNRRDQAQELLVRHVAQEPDDAFAWERLAACRNSAEDFTGAMEAANEALRLDPYRGDAHLRRSDSFRFRGLVYDAADAAREARRLLPQAAAPRVALAKALRMMPDEAGLEEAYDVALEGISLDPELLGAHSTLYYIARDMDRPDIAEQALHTVLRLEPTDAWARAELARMKDEANEAKLPQLAKEYSEALGADPDADHIEGRLHGVVYRLLRRTRWFALLCLLIATLDARVFPTGDDPTGLPAPWPTRMWGLVLMAVVWAVGAWRIYRKLPRGARMSTRLLLRRFFWARLAVGQALWGMLFAVVALTAPWTDRGVLRTLVLVGAVPLVLTIWFERAAMRSAD